MNSDLSLDFLRVVEQAAIACAHTMGQGDRHKSDKVAVEAMREALDTVPIDGTIVIGEGERDEAPMLYIGEKVGMAAKAKFPWGTLPAVEIAVDPLEGTNLCATGEPNAIALARHVRPEAAERIPHGAHQHGKRRKERDVLLPIEAPLEVVPAHRDAAVPAGVEAGDEVERGIGRQLEAGFLVEPDGHHREVADDQHHDARHQRAADDACRRVLGIAAPQQAAMQRRPGMRGVADGDDRGEEKQQARR